ncbi:MAG: lysostaphin resistance A-like protein [Ilumatobacteraceae bacterium]
MHPAPPPVAGPIGYPPLPPALGASLRPPPPPHPTLPLPVAWGAVLMTALPLLLAPVVIALVGAVGMPAVALVAVIIVASYGPAMAWWWYASRRYGTGRRSEDVGLIFRLRDLGWGPLTWLACLIVQVTVGALVIWVGIPFTSNTEGLEDRTSEAGFIVTMIVLAVIVAPITEEIVFRGLVMRGLLRRFSAPAAIGIQGALFGVAHVDPARGLGNIGLVLVLASVGIVLGGAAYSCRRITASIVAHAILNAAALMAVFLDIAP